MPEGQRDVGSKEVIRLMNKHVLLATLLVGTAALSAEGQTASPQISAQPANNTPLDLKITAVDWAGIDLSKLRGKGVLVDLWSTQCPPFPSELPNIPSTPNKLYGQMLL